MRELSLAEVNVISGGANTIDKQTWERLERKAMADGLTAAAMGTAFLGALVYGVSGYNLYLTAGTMVFAAPYIAIIGFLNSSARNVFPS